MDSTKKIIVSVSSDLYSDQRVQKICNSLSANDYKVLLLGRKLKNSPAFTTKFFKYKRLNLWFSKGPLFYANINVALFFNLIFTKGDVLYSNDLDTLPANYLVSKIKRKPLIYDSHEYFTEVPELINRPKVQKIWERIEKSILPNLKFCVTVSENIAQIYNSKYNTEFKLVRNFPIYKEKLILEKGNYIIYQGALNVGRGLEELIDAMPYINAKLWIAGGGDIEQQLKQKVKKLNLTERVIFLGRLNPKQLLNFTLRAKIGVSIEKDLGLNYRFALPNKIFDYLHCGTAILHSDLIEVKKLLGKNKVGEELISYDKNDLSEQLNRMLKSSELPGWQSNATSLAEEFNWQKEEKTLLNVINQAASD